MKEMKRNNNCICLNKWFGVYLWEIVICAEQSNPNNILHEVVTYVIKYHLKLWIELIRDRKYCQASFRLLKSFFFFPFFLLFFFIFFLNEGNWQLLGIRRVLLIYWRWNWLIMQTMLSAFALKIFWKIY